MPEYWQVQNNAVPTSSNASADNLEEAMWRMKIQNPDNQDVVSAHSSSYPERPDEPDCIYYLRTGLCGYGSNCRFNHPVCPGQDAQKLRFTAAQYRGELPERVGQPDCQYFLKTGTCRFGATCKFHHPRDRHDAEQLLLNILGLPMRKEEKSCLYYMRTGSCKFGIACKFHHPQPASLGAVLPTIGPAAFGSTVSSVTASSGPPYMGGLSAWSLPRAPYISGPHRHGPHAYMPFVLSPSQEYLSSAKQLLSLLDLPVMIPPSLLPSIDNHVKTNCEFAELISQGFMSPVSSTNVFGSNLVDNSKHQGYLGSSGQVHLLSASVAHFPERPDQPECQYFVKTGSCRFGPTCKFHHPKEKIAPLATSSLGPLGLPLRPGQDVCTFYSLNGICKFGPNCKFDHPLAGYSYNYSVNLSTLSIPDPHFFPYHQRNSPIAYPSETSPSKSLRMPDRCAKSEGASNKHQNPDIKAWRDTAQNATTSPAHTSPTSSKPPHNHQSD
ncbi:hypothetical protein HHK36_005708 [Tetracentron sinense]|uniref:C3H1-type domain-containing protein n=1 Tax=Tetracentron sinense TaxID=13715 RepID=A0A834ZPY3_TETSI|nr:hypothetical protein HHK36_005708 [Tetracentron sinense]